MNKKGNLEQFYVCDNAEMEKIKIFFVRFLFLKFLTSNSLLLTGKFVYMYTQLSLFFSKKK